jgi:hypothetical protein
VVLFGAGAGVPENLETCIERRYFSQIHYLALVCADDVLSERLQERPAWRGTREAAYIQENIRFNHWFQAYDRQPVIQLNKRTPRRDRLPSCSLDRGKPLRIRLPGPSRHGCHYNSR